jgi:heme A synthase
MFKVGLPSLLVALLGVIAPFALGWGVSAWLLPDRGPYVHAFLGATLTATSVGITARVLQDRFDTTIQEGAEFRRQIRGRLGGHVFASWVDLAEIAVGARVVTG